MTNLIRLAVYVAILAVTLYLAKVSYFAGGWCHSQAKINGKVVVVTGPNTGIGKETAKDMVRRGGKVYMACRSVDRCNAAAADIKKDLKVDDSRVIVMKCDLGSLKSVREFATAFKSKEKKLDILINNAGIMWIPERIETEDGFEQTMGVNHLGHFLLTNLLIDPLFAAKPSRVVTVSSLGHTFNDIDFDDLMLEKPGAYGRQASYSNSKLANVLFSKELGKRLKGFGVTSYSLHPGVIHTELQRHAPYKPILLLGDLLYLVQWPFMKSTEGGAQTTICCAVDEGIAEHTGKYYSDCAEKAPSAFAESDENAKRLWDMSVELVKLKPDEMHPLLR